MLQGLMFTLRVILSAVAAAVLAATYLLTIAAVVLSFASIIRWVIMAGH